MPFPWKSYMEGRLQDREIRKFLDPLSAAVPSAAGQLYLLASSASFPDLDSATWVPITQYDATIPAVAGEAKGVTLDTTAGTIALKIPGLWRLDFTFSMTHDENNAGRTLELRTFNVTDGIAGDVVSVAIGRNQPGTSYAINTLLDVAETDVDKPIRIEAKMATGSAGLNTITFTELGFIATYVDSFDNLGGDLTPVTTDIQNVYTECAYGGMRYRTETPVADTIGTTPEKITLYDTSLPLFGSPLHVAFDQANDEVVIAGGQGGVYEVTFFVNFVGEQGETYTFAVYLDGAPIGNDIKVRVSSADPNGEIQLDTIGRINGGSRWSVWVSADKANTTFNVIGTSLYFKRISGRFDDQGGPQALAF